MFVCGRDAINSVIQHGQIRILFRFCSNTARNWRSGRVPRNQTEILMNGKLGTILETLNSGNNEKFSKLLDEMSIIFIVISTVLSTRHFSILVTQNFNKPTLSTPLV